MFNVVIPEQGNWDANSMTELNKHINFRNLYNKFGLFDIKPLKAIPSGQKYAVYIEMYEDVFSDDGPMYNLVNYMENGRVKFEMPKRVWEDSGKGLVHWIIDWSLEAFSYETLRLHNLDETFNVSVPRQVTLITGAYIRDDFAVTAHLDAIRDFGINIVHTNMLIGNCFMMDDYIVRNREYVQEKTLSIFNKDTRPYKSVCYNRVVRPHRMNILAHMRNKGLLEQSIHSMGGHSPRCAGREYNREGLFDYLQNDLNYLNEYNGFITPIDEEDINLDENQANTIFRPHGMKSYFHIVTETVPAIQDDVVFVTEKSYKPFMLMQPFIQFGNYHNVKYLRHKGYRVFDEWIDHSYDDEPDKILRLKMFLDELDRLHAKSDEWWNNTLYDMTEDLLYNNELVMKNDSFEAASALIPLMFEFTKST